MYFEYYFSNILNTYEIKQVLIHWDINFVKNLITYFSNLKSIRWKKDVLKRSDFRGFKYKAGRNNVEIPRFLKDQHLGFRGNI